MVEDDDKERPGLFELEPDPRADDDGEDDAVCDEDPCDGLIENKLDKTEVSEEEVCDILTEFEFDKTLL